MKRLTPLFLALVFSGCFEDEPKLPQYYSKQEIDIAIDSVICYSGQEFFDHFIITSSVAFDSIHWYLNYSNPTFLLSGDTLNLPNNPYGYEVVRCFGFNGLDTTEFQLQVNYCARYIYIPIAFTPNDDGINDKWFPIYYTTDDGQNYQPASMHWEIRTLDGIKVFESENIWEQWDGRYNGLRMPPGGYLYYIELTVESEETVIYTGWIEMLG